MIISLDMLRNVLFFMHHTPCNCLTFFLVIYIILYFSGGTCSFSEIIKMLWFDIGVTAFMGKRPVEKEKGIQLRSGNQCIMWRRPRTWKETGLLILIIDICDYFYTISWLVFNTTCFFIVQQPFVE